MHNMILPVVSQREQTVIRICNAGGLRRCKVGEACSVIHWKCQKPPRFLTHTEGQSRLNG
eukprot:10178184-Alexandrium_andersonii.AAC.1